MNSKATKNISLVSVGDVSPNRDDPPSIFQYCIDAFRAADIRFGQMEAPLSDRGTAAFVPWSPCRLEAKNIAAVNKKGANFDVMSHASNHCMDYGWPAFFDTIDALKNSGIKVVGAGRNITEARNLAIIEKKGIKVGFLSYLSVMPYGLCAEDDIPGCAPLRASHYYQQVDWQPGTPPLIVTQLLPDDKKAMEEDIKKARPQVDVLVVCQHCGVHFVPALIAQYQREAAYDAIDCGADLIIQHHAHMLKGIEYYKGKAIFYGLGNFALEHDKAFPGRLRPWTAASRNLKQFYKIKPIPGWEKYGHHPDARRTMIAKAYIEDGKITKVTYVPCYINHECEPAVVKRDDKLGKEVFKYVKDISEQEDLNAKFSWEGDEVLVRPAK